MEEILRKVVKQVQKDRKAFTLAEGATHVDKSDNKRKTAFTLAEVLITLGIIGVVSVLTIPNIISNYQKKVYVTQLQKGYAQLQQAFDLAMADDEVNDMRDTMLMSHFPSDWDSFMSSDMTSFVGQLKKYMKISKFCTPTDDALNDPCFGIAYSNLDATENDFYMNHRLKLYTPSGIVYYFNWLLINESRFTEDGPLVIVPYFGRSIQIDVNGDKGPNKFGRDLFSVALTLDGNLVFEGSQEWVSLFDYNRSWQVPWGCTQGTDATFSGDYCGGRIFDNGWVMDY